MIISFSEMIVNYYIPIAVFISWLLSHLIKEFIHMQKHGRFSWYTMLFETGGMPSSHSASVSALAVAVFFSEGLSVAFWISFVFAIIIIRDAFGVRKSVSDQAKMLNYLTGHHKLEKKVRVVLGHTPVQVVMGVVLGVVVSSGLGIFW